MNRRTRKLLEIEAWSTRCLASPERGASLLKMVRSIDGGRWVPERWNAFEPIRKPFSEASDQAVIRSWTEERPPGSGRIGNYLYFRRRKPSCIFNFHARRLGPGGLNRITMECEPKPFLTPDGAERAKAILREIVVWSDAVYGVAFYSGQALRRGAMGTPLERLENAHWLNFFGQPYIDLFGRDRILSAPCHVVEEIPGNGLLVQAAPRFDSPEMIESADALLALESHLGTDAFVGYGHPDVPCRVPDFDLSDTQLLKEEKEWSLRSADWQAEPLSADHPSVPADFDRLLTTGIRFAQNMLAQYGEFHPFGASLDPRGQAALASSFPDPNSSSQEEAELLRSGLADQASQGHIRAAAVCLNVVTKLPGRSKRVDAIAVRLEHARGVAVLAFLPYHKDPFGDYEYDELSAVQVNPEIFGGSVQ